MRRGLIIPRKSRSTLPLQDRSNVELLALGVTRRPGYLLGGVRWRPDLASFPQHLCQVPHAPPPIGPKGQAAEAVWSLIPRIVGVNPCFHRLSLQGYRASSFAFRVSPHAGSMSLSKCNFRAQISPRPVTLGSEDHVATQFDAVRLTCPDLFGWGRSH
jgi:hypothetical protein